MTVLLRDRGPTPGKQQLALRLLAPYLAVMMTSTLRVSNASARKELGWTPSMPTYGDGIQRMTTAPRKAA